MSTKYNTQSDKDKVHKFIYIYILLILATSHKVTKTIFYKTKTIKPKTWSIGYKKESLMTY